MHLSTETLAVIILVLFAFISVSGGTTNMDNWLAFGPALFVEVPFRIMQAIAESMPILVPLAILGLLVYLDVLLKLVGEPLVLLAIGLFLAMYVWF